MFRIALSLLLAVAFLSLHMSPAEAQLRPPPPQMETADGMPDPGDIPDFGTNCGLCCATGGGNNCPFCNCDEFDLGCPSSVAMQSYADTAAIAYPDRAMMFLNIYWLRDRLADRKDAGNMLALSEKHMPLMTALVQKDPELRSLLTKTIVTNAPAMTDFALGKGAVTERHVADARMVALAFAATDTATGGGDLAKAIEAELLPRLSPALAGQPIDDALDCFLNLACATP